MISPLKKNLIKYGVSISLSLLLAFFYVYVRVDFADPGATALVEWYRIICDAFTIPGLILLMLGCLMSLSNTGAMDGLGYVVSIAVKMLIPFGNKKDERYYDYYQRKQQQGKVTGYGFIFITGLVFMAVAMVFFVLFYMNR